VNQRLAEIRARRERLVAQSAVQRDALALLAEHWRAPFGVADHGLRPCGTRERIPVRSLPRSRCSSRCRRNARSGLRGARF
jgi:hypothetical protein